jgi:hypothetical protein
MKIKTELVETDAGDNLDKLTKIDTFGLMKGKFQFPEVAKNDFSTEVLEEVEIAEKNLNSNLDNVDLYNNFIDTCEASKKKLKDKY